VAEVYDYLADPPNLPQWTMALGPSFRQIGPLSWIAEEPMLETGPITIGFCPRNRFGILDWEVTYTDWTLQMPTRVVANGAGSEVMMTLFAAREDSEERIESELEWMRTDLMTLKALLEQ
jgi:hypothetical protein